jgi:hypothetical protein
VVTPAIELVEEVETLAKLVIVGRAPAAPDVVAGRVEPALPVVIGGIDEPEPGKADTVETVLAEVGPVGGDITTGELGFWEDDPGEVGTEEVDFVGVDAVVFGEADPVGVDCVLVEAGSPSIEVALPEQEGLGLVVIGG